MRRQIFVIEIYRDGKEEKLLGAEVKTAVQNYLEAHVPADFRPKIVSVKEVEP